MKVLDIKSLYEDTETTIKDINKTQDQITAIQKAVREITSLNDSLKGEGGEAIRSFYDEFHQPFLIYMSSFLLTTKIHSTK